MTSTYMILIGIVSLIIALGGVIVAIRKLGPEVNKMQVDTSESLVAMAKQNAEMHRTDAAELRQRNKDLDDRMADQARLLGEALARIKTLEEKAGQVDALTAENARLMTENTRLRRERNLALEDVRKLESRVELLERTVEWRQVPQPGPQADI